VFIRRVIKGLIFLFGIILVNPSGIVGERCIQEQVEIQTEINKEGEVRIKQFMIAEKKRAEPIQMEEIQREGRSETIKSKSYKDELPLSWIPEWRVGDWWIVKVVGNRGAILGGPTEWGLPVYWRFEVIGSETIRRYECFIIKSYIIGREKDSGGVFWHQKSNLALLRQRNWYGSLEEFNIKSVQPTFGENVVIRPFATPIFPFQLDENRTVPNIRVYLYSLPKRNPRADVIQTISILSGNKCRMILLEGKLIPDLLHSYKAEEFSFEGYKEYYQIILSGDIVETKQIWHPSAPWFLYSEYSKYEDREQGRTKIKLLRSWLIDHSWLYK
jgi:hypothetical protein